MTPWLVDPVGVGALLDDAGDLRDDLAAVVADRDVVVAELLDEELALAAAATSGHPDRDTGLARERLLGPDGWSTSLAVARRHLVAFGLADDEVLAPELGLAAALLDARRVVVRVEGDVDHQTLVVREDGTVLHDHVDGDDDLHVVVLRSGERARAVLVGLLLGDPDDAPRHVTLVEGGEVWRRVVAVHDEEGPTLAVDDGPATVVDRPAVVQLVADLLV